MPNKLLTISSKRMTGRLWRRRKRYHWILLFHFPIFSSFVISLKAEQEAKITSEKDEHIKSVEAEILQLKADIYNLKDVFRKFSMYGKFLATISPEDWRKEQEAAAKRNRTRVPASIQAVLRLEEGESLEGDNYLYFKEPQELLDLFAKLEAENLSLIQQCQQAEARLEAGRAVSVKTRAELNQQAISIKLNQYI